MNDKERRKVQRRALRAKAKARAYDLLADVAGAGPVRPVAVACTDGAVRVSVVVVRVGNEDAVVGAAPDGVAGLFLSPLEAAIVNALRAAGDSPLSGKAIARRISQEYGTKLKYLLSNLEERQVVRLDSGEGYRLSMRGTESRA